MEVGPLRRLGRSPDLGLERSTWAVQRWRWGGWWATFHGSSWRERPVSTPQSTHPTSPVNLEGRVVAGNWGGCGEPGPRRGHCCQRGEAPSPRTHSGVKTAERNGPEALLFPAWGSSLSLGGLCRVAGPELCLARCPGTPKVSPYLPPSRALRPGSAPRGASWPPQCCSPALSFIAVLSVFLATHLFVPISGRSSESLAGTRGRPGWAADQDCRQRPQSRAAFVLCPLHFGESDSGALRLPLREHLLHVGWTANNRSTRLVKARKGFVKRHQVFPNPCVVWAECPSAGSKLGSRRRLGRVVGWGLLWKHTKAAVSVLMKLGPDTEVLLLLSPRKGPQPCQSIFCRCTNPLGTVSTAQSCLLNFCLPLMYLIGGKRSV